MAKERGAIVRIKMKVRDHEFEMQGISADVHRASEAWFNAIAGEGASSARVLIDHAVNQVFERVLQSTEPFDGFSRQEFADAICSSLGLPPAVAAVDPESPLTTTS